MIFKIRFLFIPALSLFFAFCNSYSQGKLDQIIEEETLRYHSSENNFSPHTKLKHIDSLIKIADPGSLPEFYYRKVQVLFQIGKSEEAILIFEKTLKDQQFNANSDKKKKLKKELAFAYFICKL